MDHNYHYIYMPSILVSGELFEEDNQHPVY